MNRTHRRQARDPQPDAVWLAAGLREQAQRHEADAGRISTRFEYLTAGERRPGELRRREPRRYAAPTRLRLIGVPLGVLALASATVAVAASLDLGNSPAAHSSSKVAAPPGGPRAVPPRSYRHPAPLRSRGFGRRTGRWS